MHLRFRLDAPRQHFYLHQKGMWEMGRPAERWPTKALGALELTVDRLKELEKAAKAAQDALVAGNTLAASGQMGDVRVMAMKCVGDLVNARIGKYEQEKAQQWQRAAASEEKAAEAVTRVMAARRP